MPGPAPSVDPVRRNARTGPVRLPAEGRKGEPPEWPVGGRVSAAERKAWAELWSTPQAAAWDRLGSGTRREVARYCRLLVRAERVDATAAVHSQATALADRLGLTPKAMRMLLWEIVSDEVTEKRESSEDDVRSRIKAV